MAEGIKPYSVKPPVPTITELTWPKAETHDWVLELEEQPNSAQSHADQRHVWNVIED